jgi:hypothetical protein
VRRGAEALVADELAVERDRRMNAVDPELL